MRALAKWRRLGVRRGTAGVVRVLGERARGPVREQRLRRRPLRAEADDVRAALGGVSAANALRGPVLRALPTVAAFERELRELSPEGRGELLGRADALVAHRFDLLGSGEVELGPEIDWLTDFRSGRRWPQVHRLRVPIQFPDRSDVFVPRQLSRFQHLPVLAAAGRLTGDARYLAEISRQLDHWIANNPVEIGVGWLRTIDVALRSANWVAALALCAEMADGAPWLDRAVGSLLLHGRFIRGHLERSVRRNNYYLSNIVGVLPVAALFHGGREGRAWVEWASRELIREMEFQVRPDGCSFEASTSYHAFACELFVCGTQALEALGASAPGWYHTRLERMLDFVGDYTRPDGLAPQIGDSGDARFLPLGDYARADHRSHIHLFRQAGRARRTGSGHAAYRCGGYYVMRGADLYAIVRCGDVGNDGCGWHAHNDQLSFELALGTQPMVVDPGTYVYTGDPDTRRCFRSTTYHATLQIGGAEQNELYSDTVFLMRDRSCAEPLRFDAAEGRASFEGRHHGFESLDPPATHTRRLDFDGPEAALTVQDTVSGSGGHLLQWTFPLAPCQAEVQGSRAFAHLPGARLTIEADGVELAVERGWYSPSYGVRVPTQFVRARRRSRPGIDVTTFRLTASSV